MVGNSNNAGVGVVTKAGSNRAKSNELDLLSRSPEQIFGRFPARPSSPKRFVSWSRDITRLSGRDIPHINSHFHPARCIRILVTGYTLNATLRDKRNTLLHFCFMRTLICPGMKLAVATRHALNAIFPTAKILIFHREQKRLSLTWLNRDLSRLIIKRHTNYA